MATPLIAMDVTIAGKKLDAWKTKIRFEFDRNPLDTNVRITFKAEDTDPKWVYRVLLPAIKLMNLDAELHCLDVASGCLCVMQQAKMDGPCSHWTEAELEVSLKC